MPIAVALLENLPQLFANYTAEAVNPSVLGNIVARQASFSGLRQRTLVICNAKQQSKKNA